MTSAFDDALSAIYKPLFIPFVNTGAYYRLQYACREASYDSFEIYHYSGAMAKKALRYLYTKERAEFQGVYGFLAVRYVLDLSKPLPTVNVKQVIPFKTKWRCKDQAYRWYCKERDIPFESLHKKRRPTKAQLERFQQWQKEKENA